MSGFSLIDIPEYARGVLSLSRELATEIEAGGNVLTCRNLAGDLAARSESLFALFCAMDRVVLRQPQPQEER